MIVLTTIMTILAAGNPYDGVFDAGIAAYDAGDFAGAAVFFEQLIDQGIQEDDVFYDLGNAYYRLGRKGEAIANFERALQINPRHSDARRNLDKVLAECPRGLAKPLPPEWERALLFWHGGISRSTSTILATILWLGGWALLCIRQVKTIRRLTAPGILLLLAGAAFGASWYAKSHPQLLAVAINEKASVHYGTDEDDKVRFELFVGDHVRIEAEEGEWVRVDTISRERGWTRSENLVRIGPPYTGYGAASLAARPGQ